MVLAMDYLVSKEELKRKFIEWREAMMLELSNSLNLNYNYDFTREYEIDSILKYNLLVSGIAGLLHTRFRGEARYHNNPCLPIIARNYTEAKDKNYEIEEINRFKESLKAHNLESRLEKNDITFWMLAQHHVGYETRLLDITRNSLVALYFACQKHPNEDGYVYVFHSMDKTSIPLNPSYSTYSEHIRDDQKYYQDDVYTYMRPTVSLDRINRQEGEFLWIKNFPKLRTEGLFETKQIIPILIKKEHKSVLLKELNDPQGINDEYLNIDQY